MKSDESTRATLIRDYAVNWLGENGVRVGASAIQGDVQDLNLDRTAYVESFLLDTFSALYDQRSSRTLNIYHRPSGLLCLSLRWETTTPETLNVLHFTPGEWERDLLSYIGGPWDDSVGYGDGFLS